MSAIERLERYLHQRPAGWWEKLCEVIPELCALSGTSQQPEYHAEGDVATHTRLAIENCPAGCDPDLLWIALLHDIAKPATTKRDGAGRITAHGHARLGGAMAEVILARLEIPEKRLQRITWAIRHHMFHHAWQLTNPAKLTNRQRRYLANADFPLLLEFMLIDAAASRGSSDITPIYNFYRQLWQEVSRA
jgi:putative nucleotidyltransferase with HDIG domain